MNLGGNCTSFYRQITYTIHLHNSTYFAYFPSVTNFNAEFCKIVFRFIYEASYSLQHNVLTYFERGQCKHNGKLTRRVCNDEQTELSKIG